MSLGAESELEVTVSYATADDTADEDDYTSASGTLTFEAGDRAKTITVTTEDDDLDEAASEQFKLTLSSAATPPWTETRLPSRSWARSRTTTIRRCCRWRT